MATATWDKRHRGRYADAPQEIPAKGWKDTFIRVKQEITKDRISLISGAMAYYSLLAMVPGITSMILIYAWVSDPAEVSQHINKAQGFLPADILNILREQMTSLAGKAAGALGLSAIGTLLFSLWSASKASKALIEAMNMIYDEEDQRGFIKSNLLAIGLTLLGAVLSVVAIFAVVAIPAFFAQFELPTLVETGVTAGSWLLLICLFALYLAFVYRYGPHRNEAKWRWVSVGAIIAAVLWVIFSALFSWYATEFGNFNKTYGSLGAVVVLMTWFYFTSFVVLLGAEINAESEHQTKKDTTVGEPEPMGTRGARMADTVGESAEELKRRK